MLLVRLFDRLGGSDQKDFKKPSTVRVDRTESPNLDSHDINPISQNPFSQSIHMSSKLYLLLITHSTLLLHCPFSSHLIFLKDEIP